MNRATLWRLAPAIVLLTSLVGTSARGGGIAVTNDTNAADIVNALLGGGAGGIYRDGLLAVSEYRR